jgi:signal transduction histidine kinase
VAGPLAIAISNARAYAAAQHLARELTERNHALVKQRDQLQEMNRLKSEFLANVSHELRTPLNAISGYTELMEEGIYGPVTDDQKEALEGVEESSRNLLTLINQILDLSKVESGKIEMYVTEVPIHDVIQAVVAEAQPLCKDKPFKVQARCPTRVVIKTDGAKVKQILTNLVSNAVKFTDKGGVMVELKPDSDGGCSVAVRDTGIGIRPEDQQIIFEEFRQVDGSSTRKYSGTGLGLAIARRFAILCSGGLTVESQHNVGSIFTLRLPPEPRSQSTPRPPPSPPAAQQRRITAKIEAVPPPLPGRGK